MKLDERIKEAVSSVHARQDNLIKGWADYLNPVREAYKVQHGKTLSPQQERMIAQCLENASMNAALQSRGKLFEATDSSNIEFLGVQLPVIAALIPSLVLNELTVTQPLDRRVGSIFYLDVKYGSDKGTKKAGDTMMSAKDGHDRAIQGGAYAATKVVDEQIGAAGTAAYTGIVDYFPVIAGTLVITDGTTAFVDNGKGVLENQGSGDDGSIDYASGEYSVTFASNTTQAPGASYRYNYEQAANGVPEVDLDFTSEPLEAEDFALKANFSLGAAIDAEKAQGIKLENELVKYLAAEIRFSMDRRGIEMMVAASKSADAAGGTGGVGTWNATPGSGNQWVLKKYEFLDQIAKGNNLIISKSLRGMATFILAGNDVARVISQMGDHFKPAADFGKKTMTGPTIIGTLDGRPVVQDPFMPSGEYTLGFKGDGFLFAGAVFAPYIPLFSTPTLTTADLKSQKGFLSAGGYKMVNKGMYTAGKITGLL